MAGAGSFLVGAALIAVAITLGPSLFVDRSPTTVAAVTALPGGTGRILVLNDDPGSIDRGIELVGRLSGLGWEPVTNATTEAVFRRALGPAGSGSPDLESFARGALQDLRLQAVAILRVPVEGDRESEVVVITGEDSVTCYPFIATP